MPIRGHAIEHDARRAARRRAVMTGPLMDRAATVPRRRPDRAAEPGAPPRTGAHPAAVLAAILLGAVAAIGAVVEQHPRDQRRWATG